jgi:hypothetical protein
LRAIGYTEIDRSLKREGQPQSVATVGVSEIIKKTIYEISNSHGGEYEGDRQPSGI